MDPEFTDWMQKVAAMQHGDPIPPVPGFDRLHPLDRLDDELTDELANLVADRAADGMSLVFDDDRTRRINELTALLEPPEDSPR